MLNEGELQERRQHRRSHVGGTVFLDCGGQNIKARIENISLGGLCATAPQALPLGSQLSVDIPLSNGDVVVVRAKVVRSFMGNAAMRFYWLSEDDRSRLLLKEQLSE